MQQLAITKKEKAPISYGHENYIDYCLQLAKDKLSGVVSKIEDYEANINKYEKIDFLQEPRNICRLDEKCLKKSDIAKACKCVLGGKLFSEHAAAGEATRLGIGTKYLINIAEDLSLKKIAEVMTREKGSIVKPEEVLGKAGYRPEQLLPLSLGSRHMLQFSYDIYKLAKNHGYDPKSVLSKQHMLIVLNEASANKIIKEFINNRFFGFNNENVFFMIQKAYHGINFVNGKYIYNKNTPKRLHNHGQMAMQQTIDNQIFKIDNKGTVTFLKSDEFGGILKKMEDKISYNIEDLAFLTASIDYESLALALKKAEHGYRMLMEIVGNDMENPQKGGLAAFDTMLGKNVMIESFQLKGIKNHEIKYLNKNFNHYPRPYDSWLMLKKHGLNMPIVVKDGAIYFQSVQGDINFLVRTEFFKRKVLKPINSWKSPATTPQAIKYMHMQDLQKGFKEYAEAIIGSKLSCP
ncbi:MAG: hypothetical protein MUO43_00315 [Desulfobacterales bacterium]|nr:hypothetical protein [Desulfobacterales bacterium]